MTVVCLFLGYFIVSKFLNRKIETNKVFEETSDSKKYLSGRTMSEEEFKAAELIFNNKKEGYIIKHWRGNHSLSMSFWVNNVTISILFAICLVIYMKKSKLGRAIRATAQNSRAAKILGVDTEKVYAATFGINAALCGVAGALISITFTIHPYMGLPYTIRSFMIVIVAGLGNLPGVAISGMGLGVFEEFADYILGTEFRIGSVFLLLVLILVYRRFKLSRKREYLK